MSPNGPRVALVLVVALLAVPVGAAESPSSTDGPERVDGGTFVVSLPNTTNQATPKDISRRTFGQANIDIAGAVASGSAQLHGRHARLTFGERLDRAGTGREAKLAVVREAIADVERRVATLERRQQRLFESYSNGSIATGTFLRRLAELEVTADQQLERLDQIENRAATTDLSLPVTLRKRIIALRTELVLLPSPISDRIAAAVSGSTAGQSVYLAAADDGLVMATIRDETYRREATLRGQRAPGQPNRFRDQSGSPITEANQRAEELYPWVYANAISFPRIRGFADTSVYRMTATHPQGEIWTYLDGATTNVFRERQTKRLSAVPVSDTLTNTTGSVQLSVATTHVTGPMRVTVTDTATDEPVNATVLVDGQRVGQTGSDGTLWTIQPATRFTVNATTATINVTVQGA